MNILIFQTAFIGDLVLASSLIKSVKLNFPESKVTLVCKKGYESIYKGFPYLKEVIPYDKSKKFNVFSFASLLKEKKFDVVLSPHRSFRTSLILFLSKIPVRIGFDTAACSFLYTETAKYEKGIHEVERNSRLLLKLKSDAKLDLFPELTVTEDEKRAVREKFNLNERFAVIAPGSVWPTKRWIPEYFAEVSKYLYRKGILPVIVGSKGDVEIAKETETFFPEIFNIAGKTSLRELMAIISLSEIVVTNDSSPTHFATAFNVPVVTIFGPTVPQFGFYPYRDNGKSVEIDLECRPCGIHGGKKCKEGHFKCMRDLKPERVISAINELLGI